MVGIFKLNRMTDRLIKNKKIAIIGGGPGGLSLARLLQIRGGDVTVYERDKNRYARIQGSSLDLHQDSGQLLIEAAGLAAGFKKVSRPEGEQHRIYDKRGTLILDIPAYKVSSARPEIDRGVLRDLLLDSLQADTVVWNKHFLSLSTIAGHGFELCFQDGQYITADLVIAADGSNSRIRQYITPIRPQYSGTTLIQGEVTDPATQCPQIYDMVHKGNMFVLGDERALLLQQKGDGTLVFYVTARHPEDWIRTSGIDFKNGVQVIEFLDLFFESWNPIFLTLFRASTDFIPRPMYGTPVDQAWETQTGLTMIGDAAHVMPPFAGVGVNMAMLDALELADCLTSDKFDNVTNALRAYEKNMLERTGKAQANTKNSEDIFHSPTAITDLLKKLETEETTQKVNR
jgi:2-polyprenyl-6-methoxyphenol hydroxylase-like FAD-dependent oxidoreductase